eukprot:GILJ01008538.1.p1 GENE.GILJ01008538.1~~GILJ01008538.1.p1  ORF type:complete len:312 (-),score=14.37 GILJ01008538.1:467-1270(-)
MTWTVEKDVCSTLELHTDFYKMELSLKSLSDTQPIQSLLITDSSECVTSTAQCIDDSSLCFGTSKSLAHSVVINNCAQSAFAHVVSSTATQLFVASAFKQGVCHGVSTDDSINRCARLASTQCENSCACGWLACQRMNDDGFIIEPYGFCLAQSSAPNSTVAAAFCQGATQTEFRHSCPVGWGARLFMTTIICMLCVVLFSALLYNVYMRRHRMAPFQMPDWCPKWLFPRSLRSSRHPRQEHLLRTPPRARAEDGYQLPDFYGDDRF